MNKLVRIFTSQIFNSFFPLIIVAILLHISNKSDSAPIFVIINFANTYLLFSDYSSNIRFIKEAVQLGGIKKNLAPEISTIINHYVGIKIIVLLTGFIPWIAISLFTPILHQHFLASLAAYVFIVANSFNFYWIYAVSSKEYFFILSNFLSKLSLIAVLLLFLYFKIPNDYVMFFSGLLGIIVSFFFFYRFCRVYQIHVQLNFKTLKESFSVIVSDFRFVTSSFSLMAPTLGLTFFLGYVQQPEKIIIYALAEKIFLGLRTLLSIIINSIYPILCKDNKLLEPARIRKMLFLFYTSVIIVCAATYLFAPFLTDLVKIPAISFPFFKQCLMYFLLVIIVVSLNVPFMLWLMLSNEMQSKRTAFFFSIAAFVIFTTYVVNLIQWNTAVSLIQTLLVGEVIIVLTFLFLYKSRRTNFSPKAIIPAI